MKWQVFGIIGSISVLTACGSDPTPVVPGPLTARPAYSLATIDNQGAIFQPSSSRMLFEDQLARYVGDTLRVNIRETLSNSSSTASSQNRDSTFTQKGPGAASSMGGVLKEIYDYNGKSDGGDTYKGSGSNSNSNTLVGSMMVTVIQVLPNGNLIVAGERTIATDGTNNVFRLSAVVNPRDIKANNEVASTNLADVKIEQVINGRATSTRDRNGLQQFVRSLVDWW